MAFHLACAALLGPAFPGVLSAAEGVWTEPRSGIEFVRVGAGCFDMGEVAARRPGADFVFPVPLADELPRHRACVGEFWIGRTEVTRDQWARVMHPGSPPSARPQQAMYDVSWEDGQRFVAALSEGARREATRRVFRLPTEVEWEYACHAGDRRPAGELGGEEAGAEERWTVEHAWYRYPFIRDRWSHDVGLKKANAWGLHDMLGNVMEWVEDAYVADGYVRHAGGEAWVVNPGAPKVTRGGSFRSPRERVRCGARFSAPATERTPVIGLRVVMVVEDTK